MNLEELFCIVDDFCIKFVPEWEKTLLSWRQPARKKPGQLTMIDQIIIYLLFKSSGYRASLEIHLLHDLLMMA